MGNAASKEDPVEPPPEWDPTSNAQQYVVESPMSDVSDPSMFLHLRPHPKLSDATVQQIAGNKKKTKSGKEPPAFKLPAEQRKVGAAPPPRASRQTPAGERRRRSKVITRDSAYKHESRPRELAPPSSFYFPNVPTRESEENLNRLSVRKSSSTGARRQSNTTKSKEDGVDNGAEQQDQQQGNKENNVRKNTPLFKKAKRRVNRATSCLTGCFEESTHNIQLMKDNAKPETKRGERLPSEAGVGKESLLKVEEEPILEEEAFDPYQENPLQKSKSTAMQFVDGTGKELTFNPVWRESHDGTYHSDPSSMAESSRRASDFALSKRTSRESTRRASDPSIQSRNKSYPTKNEEAVDGERNQAPHPPGGKSRKSVGSINDSSRRSVNNNSAAGSDSVATSHESTYWNDFYKDTQILHHEDSYFDRIAFVPNKSSEPEPSPMANQSAATPIVALFGQDKPKSLLGSMERGSMDRGDLDANGEPKICSSDSFLDDGMQFTNRPSETNSRRNSRGLRAPSDEERDGPSLSGTSRTEDLSAQGRKKIAAQPQKANCVSKSVKSDVTDSKNGRASTDDAFALVVVQDSEPVGTEARNKEEQEGALVPFDEGNEENFGKPPKDSFLDNRITADRILVQTSLVRKIPKDLEPRRDTIDIRAALQATPQNAVVEHRTSIGSAFSYKDRDVFTPVTSLTTYPKGSPFRPRVAVNEMTMAKAELDRPVQLEKPAMYTQSCDNMSRSSSRDMTIQACESAPSMIESHDYRDIALGCFQGDTPTNNAKERALALFSPGVMSIESPMSTAKSPAQPLLSNQVVNNAAFLFSPSYASGMSLTSGPAISIGKSEKEDSSQQSKQLVKKTKSSPFSISTLGSRSRLSGRSKKSKKSIRIPFSSSGSLPPIKSGSRKSSISDDGSRQKSVRFSGDGQSVAEQSESASQKSRRSVTWDFSFKAAPENVDIPAIETKVSDLSDTVFGRDPSPVGSTTMRGSIESVKSNSSGQSRESTIKEEEATASLTSSEAFSRHSRSQGSTRASQESSSKTGTPEQGTKTWTYNEFSRGVTPLLDRKQLAQASTNSPVLRFKAAKNKFVGTHSHEKEVPVKKSPSFNKRKAGTGRVHLLASKFDKNGGHSLEPPMTDRPTSVTAPQGERPKMLRTPQIIGYAPKSYPSIYERASIGSHTTASSIKPVSSWGAHTMQTRTMSTDESEAAVSTVVNRIPEEDSDADDASDHSSECSDDDTFVQSVATLRQDRHMHGQNTHVIIADPEEDRLDEVLDEILHAESTDSQESSGRSSYNSGGDVPCDEAADDFAELLLNNILSAPSQDEGTVATARQNPRTLKGMRSGSWQDDDENSTFTNILAAPTFSDESTTMSAMLATQKPANLRHGAKTVKPQPHPRVQQLHTDQSVPAHALHLSPNMRTATQASKWRELAERAQKNDNNKKSIFRGTGKKTNKKSLLSERNTNIQ